VKTHYKVIIVVKQGADDVRYLSSLPVYPGAHVQWYASVASTHVPPCWHVTSRQSSMLTSQMCPLNPAWQRHIGRSSYRTQREVFTAQDRLCFEQDINSVNTSTFVSV